MPEYLTDIGTVYFFREPEMGGNAFAKGVIAQLAEIRYGGKIYEIKAPKGIKDPNDWHKSDPAAFPEQFRGWKRLRERGYFLQPSAWNEAVRELEDLGSPVAAFVRERCETSGGHEVECQRLYDAWKRWCEEYGRDHAGTAHSFGRDLRAVVPELKTLQRRTEDTRKGFYQGIWLLTER